MLARPVNTHELRECSSRHSGYLHLHQKGPWRKRPQKWTHHYPKVYPLNNHRQMKNMFSLKKFHWEYKPWLLVLCFLWDYCVCECVCLNPYVFILLFLWLFCIDCFVYIPINVNIKKLMILGEIELCKI